MVSLEGEEKKKEKKTFGQRVFQVYPASFIALETSSNEAGREKTFFSPRPLPLLPPPPLPHPFPENV